MEIIKKKKPSWTHCSVTYSLFVMFFTLAVLIYSGTFSKPTEYQSVIYSDNSEPLTPEQLKEDSHSSLDKELTQKNPSL